MNQQVIMRQYAAHTGNLSNGACFKRIGSNMADVFVEEGFQTPTRHRLIRGAWVHVTGPKLADTVAAELPR